MTVCLDLYAEEPVTRGSHGRLLREAGVSFGRPTVGPVADDELPSFAQRRPDLGKWRFTQLVLPFDLEDLSSGKRYAEATIRMTFDDPDVRSLVMSRPLSTDADEDNDIDTWGVGRSELAWKLTARDVRLGIRPSGRLVQAVLESPLSSDRITGTLGATARVLRTMLGWASQVDAEPRRPLRFVLNVADGSFEFALNALP
jgi:hypothetical protein